MYIVHIVNSIRFKNGISILLEISFSIYFVPTWFRGNILRNLVIIQEVVCSCGGCLGCYFTFVGVLWGWDTFYTVQFTSNIASMLVSLLLGRMRLDNRRHTDTLTPPGHLISFPVYYVDLFFFFSFFYYIVSISSTVHQLFYILHLIIPCHRQPPPPHTQQMCCVITFLGLTLYMLNFQEGFSFLLPASLGLSTCLSTSTRSLPHGRHVNSTRHLKGDGCLLLRC